MDYNKAIHNFLDNNNISDPALLLKKVGFTDEKEGKQTIADIINNPSTFYPVFINIILWLCKADQKYIFTHGSLSISNIFIEKKNVNMELDIVGDKYTIVANYTPLIKIITDKMVLVYKGVPVIDNGVYAPGIDLYNLLSEIVNLNSEYKWMMDYLYNGMNENHPMYKKPIIDFVKWMRANKPELFIVVNSTPKKLETQTVDLKLNSAILLTYFGNKINDNNIEYDRKCISRYIDLKKVNYPLIVYNNNFPIPERNDFIINCFYAIYSAVKLIQVWYSIKNTSGTNTNNLALLKDDFQKMEIGMYKLFLYLKRYLYANNYSIFSQIKKLYDNDGASLEILMNEKNIMDGLFELNSMKKDLRSVFNTCRKQLIGLDTLTIYYPTFTLKQINNVMARNKQSLSILIAKHFHNKEALNVINNKKNDIEIYTELRKYVEHSDFDRGKARVNDLKVLLFDTDIWKEYTENNKDIRYLDFGGNDGSISVSFAEYLKIDKINAFSADITIWFDRVKQHMFEQITFLDLKNDIIPLPDKSIDLITVFQVLHHIENLDKVLSELYRVCKKFLVIREHDCRDTTDKMIIDIEHSLYEVTIEKTQNIKFLNDYHADYKSIKEWDSLLQKHGFKKIPTKITIKGPTRYYYSIYSV